MAILNGWTVQGVLLIIFCEIDLILFGNRNVECQMSKPVSPIHNYETIIWLISTNSTDYDTFNVINGREHITRILLQIYTKMTVLNAVQHSMARSQKDVVIHIDRVTVIIFIQQLIEIFMKPIEIWNVPFACIWLNQFPMFVLCFAAFLTDWIDWRFLNTQYFLFFFIKSHHLLFIICINLSTVENRLNC